MRNTWLSFDFDASFKEQMFEINATLDYDAIDVMDYPDIHMTSVFFGKKLKGLNQETLIDINSVIAQCSQEVSSIELRFDRFSLFPPNKNNLVVALYENNDHLTRLVNDLKTSLPEYSDSTPHFIPHITIGRLNAGYQIELHETEHYPDITIHGLALDGDRIKHMNNHYAFR